MMISFLVAFNPLHSSSILDLLLQQFATLLDVPHPHRDALDFDTLMSNLFNERTYKMLDFCILLSWTLGPMR